MKLGCVDETNGATDKWGRGCDLYKDFPSECGNFDDTDFKAITMCCSCKMSGNL